MKLHLHRSLDADAQQKLAETRTACAAMVADMSDSVKLELFLVCRVLADNEGQLGFAGCLAMLGFMESMCNLARKQQQESN